MKSAQILRGLLTCFIVLALSLPASAAITLYDKDETTFSVDGSFNTFYVYSQSDKNTEMEAISGPDRDQSRVKMGFLPNWIGFNFGKQVGDLKLGGRSSFWVTINDSDNNLTETGIDVRQFYGTVDSSWGQILFGKDFTLFNRSNIFLDEILLGYGNVSDTLGLLDGNGVSFGNIGTGYTYPFPSAQITYRTPELHGFKLAIGIIDPSRTVDNGQEKTPRFEGELTYNYQFNRGDITAWSGFLYQKSESTSAGITDITTKGVSYGVRVRFANVGLHASGFNAEGLGFLLGAGADTTIPDLTVAGDSEGYLLQASYTHGPVRLVGSYGQNELKAAQRWKNETMTGAVFYDINQYFKAVAEYNVNEISIGSAKEETNTIALGLIVNF
ncbi:MAG: porin [Desulfuromonadales bacterium]|nr:porin [Desulfuromonadales bacterium]